MISVYYNICRTIFHKKKPLLQTLSCMGYVDDKVPGDD